MRKLLLALILVTGLVGVRADAQIATLPVVSSAAYEASHVIKNAPGTLWAFTVNNHSSTANLYVMIFNATSLPSNGATTGGTASGDLEYCDVVPAALTSPTALDGQTFKAVIGGLSFSVGITMALSTSSSGCGSLTIDTNTDGWFWAQAQ